TENALRHIASIRVQVGTKTKIFSASQICHWQKVAPARWALPEVASPIISMEIPWVRSDGITLINFPEKAQILLFAAAPGVCFATAWTILLFAVWQIVDRPLFQ